MASSISFTPDDTREWGIPMAGPGLLLDVPREGPWARRPALHFEAAPGYRLRLSSGGQPLLWVRVDGYWDQCGFLRGVTSAPWGLPSLSAAEVREVTHASDTLPWWEAWMWRLGRALARPDHPVLHAGRWCLRPVRAIRPAVEAYRYPISPMDWRFGQQPSAPHSLEGVLRFERFWVEDWAPYGLPSEEGMFQGAVVPLREPSPAEDGRVKSWRKFARAGALPPALLLYVDLLGKWLVIDGHDRIHAALLEGGAPPLLGLWPVHEQVLAFSPEGQRSLMETAELRLRDGAPQSVVDRVNRMLLLNFEELKRGTVTRAWVLQGGRSAWVAEVLAWRRWNPFPADDQGWEWFVSPKA